MCLCPCNNPLSINLVYSALKLLKCKTYNSQKYYQDGKNYCFYFVNELFIILYNVTPDSRSAQLKFFKNG